MSIREHTNRECELNRLNLHEVRRYDDKEKALLDGLEAAKAAYTGKVTVVPMGALGDEHNISYLYTSEASRTAARERIEARKNREPIFCKQPDCIREAYYRKIGYCRPCYNKAQKAACK
jgi:hypothetical protein